MSIAKALPSERLVCRSGKALGVFDVRCIKSKLRGETVAAESLSLSLQSTSATAACQHSADTGEHSRARRGNDRDLPAVNAAQV